jgi:cytochrome b561
MHISFLNHANGRYFWVAIALVGASIVAYLLQEPHQTPNGGTWLGYTLGTMGALLILWLIYLGRRKRNFAAGWGTVRGWVSAHVYLGTSLLVVATLHTGFQFGINVHTLAYVLMCVVIVSGLYGVWAYRTYPEARNELKRSQTLDDIFLQLEDIDGQLKRDVSALAADIRGVVSSAIDRTEIGGGMYAQLAGVDSSKVMIDGNVYPNTDQVRVVAWLVQRLSLAEGSETGKLSAVVRSYGARQKLLQVIRSDIRFQALQEAWLNLHVPLSIALLAALLTHIVSVFIYW